jgi:hypothetical protein
MRVRRKDGTEVECQSIDIPVLAVRPSDFLPAQTPAGEVWAYELCHREVREVQTLELGVRQLVTLFDAGSRGHPFAATQVVTVLRPVNGQESPWPSEEARVAWLKGQDT